jgi:transcriptional regulator with XRE-family HTH domain
MPAPPRVRNALVRLLYRRGWSDVDLAARTRLSRSRVNRLKNGRADPSVGEALRIATALGVAVEDVFWLAEPEAPATGHPR